MTALERVYSLVALNQGIMEPSWNGCFWNHLFLSLKSSFVQTNIPGLVFNTSGTDLLCIFLLIFLPSELWKQTSNDDGNNVFTGRTETFSAKNLHLNLV